MIFSGIRITGHNGAFSITTHPGRISFQSRRSHGLVLYTDGECPYIYEDISFTARAGNLIYLPQGVPYEIRPACDSACLLINFTTDEPLGIPAFMRKMKNYTSLQNIFHSAIRAYGAKKAGFDASVIGDAYRVIAEIQMSESIGYVPGDKAAKIRRASEILETGLFDQSLTVAYLASECGISEKYFTSVFSELNGCTPKKYILQSRIEAAKTMLAYGNAPIGDVAFACGFTNRFYFAKCFRETVGCTPSEYRNIYIK